MPQPDRSISQILLRCVCKKNIKVILTITTYRSHGLLKKSPCVHFLSLSHWYCSAFWNKLQAAFTLGALIQQSLGTNVTIPFFQVPTLEHGNCAGTRVQGLDLVLEYKSGHRVRRSLCAHNFCKFRAVQCVFLAAKLMFQIKWCPTGRNGKTMRTVTYRVLKVWPQHHFVPVSSHHVWTVP